jgi:hypothetical protein
VARALTVSTDGRPPECHVERNPALWLNIPQELRTVCLIRRCMGGKHSAVREIGAPPSKGIWTESAPASAAASEQCRTARLWWFFSSAGSPLMMSTEMTCKRCAEAFSAMAVSRALPAGTGSTYVPQDEDPGILEIQRNVRRAWATTFAKSLCASLWGVPDGVGGPWGWL